MNAPQEPQSSIAEPGSGARNTLAGMALAIIALGVVITGLVVGSAFLIPLAVALLLWNLLIALVEGFATASIAGYRMPRALAAVLGIGSAVIAVGVAAFILLDQADAIAAAWPRYAARLSGLAGDLSGWLGPERSAKVRALLADLDFTRWTLGLLASTGSFLGYTLQVVAYTAFLFVERGYVADKLTALFDNPQRASEARLLLENISTSIRRYVWIKSVVSAMTGLASYAVLKAFGVDFAETWGLLAFVLNFIPYIGTYIAVIMPVLVSMVQFDTLMTALLVLLSLMVVQTAFGSIIDPMWTGQSLNMSPFAIVLSLIFWGMVWGIAGMFLSVPFLVVIIIVCAKIPDWRWVAILLSRDGRVPA